MRGSDRVAEGRHLKIKELRQMRQLQNNRQGGGDSVKHRETDNLCYLSTDVSQVCHIILLFRYLIFIKIKSKL